MINKNSIKKINYDSLCIVSDFDGTITIPVVSSLGVFRKVFGESYKNELNSLMQRIIKCSNLSDEMKTRMYAVGELKILSKYLKLNYDLSSLANLFQIRGSYDEFVNYLSANNIPLFINSSGIGNIIEMVLKYYGLGYYDLVCSNYYDRDYEFDLNGIIYSKRKYNSDLLDCVKGKEVILLGDSECDISGVSDILTPELSIGFNNGTIGNDTKYDQVLSKEDDYKKVLKIIK